LKLNVAEVPQYAIFEGEVIVAEGFMDSRKFNVNRIWKPTIGPVNKEIFNYRELSSYQKNLDNKAVQVMVACGPFTVSNELSYDALKDLLAVVNRD